MSVVYSVFGNICCFVASVPLIVYRFQEFIIFCLLVWITYYLLIWMFGQFIISHISSQLRKLQSACAFLLVDNLFESNPLSSY